MKLSRNVAVFFLVNLFLTAFYLDPWFNPNSVTRALTVQSLVNEGNFQIDAEHERTIDKSLIDGHWYSEKAPFPAMLVAPFFKTVKLFIGEPDNTDAEIRSILILSSFLCAALPFAILVTLLFIQLKQIIPHDQAVLWSLLPFYGSFVFVFAGSFFSHVFTGSLLLFSYLLLKKEHSLFLAGTLAGGAFLSEYPTAIIVGLWGVLLLYRTRSFKNFILYSAGVLPFIVFLLIYNYRITGSPFTMLYAYVELMPEGYGLGLPDPVVAFRLLFGQYRGLLFYMPVLALVLFYLIKNKVYQNRGFFTHYMVVPFTAYFLVFSSYQDWWGGWSYGPRQLIPIAIPIAFEGMRYLSKQIINRKLFWGVTGFGLLCAFLAKTTILYNLPTDYQYPMIEVVWSKLMNGTFNDGNLLSILFGAKAYWANSFWIVLFSGLIFWQYRFQSRKPSIN